MLRNVSVGWIQKRETAEPPSWLWQKQDKNSDDDWFLGPSHLDAADLRKHFASGCFPLELTVSTCQKL